MTERGGVANGLPVNPWGLRGMESHPATLRLSAESTWGSRELIHAKGEAVEVENVRIQKPVVGWSGVGVMLGLRSLPLEGWELPFITGSVDHDGH